MCPELVKEDTIVYSFGIGEDITFDLAVIEKFDSKVFGFDPTPKSINWIATQKTPINFTFYDYGIDKFTAKVHSHLLKNPNNVSGSIISHANVNSSDTIEVQMKSFKDITNELGHTKIDILKMDIEGAEYTVLEDILNSGIQIKQLLIEFHDLFVSKARSETRNALKQIRSNGFEIVAVSDSLEEISFVNSKYI